MEFFQFVFSSGWVFFGFVFAISVVCSGITDIIKAARGNNGNKDDSEQS